MILILGYGFLGKTLADYFYRHQIDFKVADRNVHALSEKNHVYFDLTNPDTYEDAFRDVDRVIHLIHPTVPADSEYNASIDLVYNFRSNETLLHFLSKHPLKKLLFISSGGAIYGEPEYLPVDEAHPCRPVSNYGKGKLMLEELYSSLCAEYGIPLKILRPSNIYGRFQDTAKPQGVIAYMAEAIRKDLPFVLWGSGENKKDFLYAEDFCTAVDALLSSTEGSQIIYNISSGKSYSLLEIIQQIESIVHKKMKLSPSGEKGFDVKNVLLSHQGFSEDYGWQPKYSLEDGLKELFN